MQLRKKFARVIAGDVLSRNNWTLHLVQGDEKLFKSGTRTPSRQDDESGVTL